MAKHVELKPDVKQKPKKRWVASVSAWAWTTVAVMLVFEALIANNQATNGQQLASLQEEQSQLSLQIDELERQVSATGSLQNVRQRATDQLGLMPVDKNIMYISLPEPMGAQP